MRSDRFVASVMSRDYFGAMPMGKMKIEGTKRKNGLVELFRTPCSLPSGNRERELRKRQTESITAVSVHVAGNRPHRRTRCVNRGREKTPVLIFSDKFDR